MSRFYANLTLANAAAGEVLAYLKQIGAVAYVSPAARGMTVVFHEDLSAQEDLARQLSSHFSCAVLLVMAYGDRVLLYQLYQAGEQIDAYVSSPHEELDTGDQPTPEGNAATLCAAFEVERAERRVETILRKESKPGHAYEYAANRHGELARAMGLPLFAVGAGYAAIEMGELPAGPDFDPTKLSRTT